jgi:hypothetical protein
MLRCTARPLSICSLVELLRLPQAGDGCLMFNRAFGEDGQNVLVAFLVDLDPFDNLIDFHDRLSNRNEIVFGRHLCLNFVYVGLESVYSGAKFSEFVFRGHFRFDVVHFGSELGEFVFGGHVGFNVVYS